MIRFAASSHEHKQLRYSTIKLFLCGVIFYYVKHGGFNPMVNYGRQLECLKSILCGIKKKQGPKFSLIFFLLLLFVIIIISIILHL